MSAAGKSGKQKNNLKKSQSVAQRNKGVENMKVEVRVKMRSPNTENYVGAIFKKEIAKNFLELVKDINTQIQVVHLAQMKQIKIILFPDPF